MRRVRSLETCRIVALGDPEEELRVFAVLAELRGEGSDVDYDA